MGEDRWALFNTHTHTRDASRRESVFPLYGLDRGELECWNVREMANPHLPFPRVHAYTKARGEEGVELRGRGGEEGHGGKEGDR